MPATLNLRDLPAVRRLPAPGELAFLRGLPAARELLLDGLSVDGRLVGTPGDPEISEWQLGRRQVFVIPHPDLVDHVLHEAVDQYHKSIEYELLRAVLGLNLFTDED